MTDMQHTIDMLQAFVDGDEVQYLNPRTGQWEDATAHIKEAFARSEVEFRLKPAEPLSFVVELVGDKPVAVYTGDHAGGAVAGGRLARFVEATDSYQTQSIQ
jgi:hypothetical protein